MAHQLYVNPHLENIDHRSAAKSVQSYTKLPFIKNQWYVLATADEITRKLQEKVILGRSLVVFRRTDGSVAALSNRCPHRAYPMSESELDGDIIKCGYHGARFDSHGKPVSVPCQTAVPRRGLRSYPVHEDGPLVWIWTGDQPADFSTLPEMDCLKEDRWIARTGVKHMPGNYLLMQDNLSDLSHLPFLHGSVFPFPESMAEQEIHLDVDKTKGTVDFYRESDTWEDIEMFYPESLKFLGNHKIRQRSGGTYETPGVFRGGDVLEVLDAKPGERTEYRNYYIHYLTPETESSTHYYYAIARDYALDDENFTTFLMLGLDYAFQQDVDAVRHMQRLIDFETEAFNDLLFSGDKASLEVRKIVARLAKEERDSEQRSVADS